MKRTIIMLFVLLHIFPSAKGQTVLDPYFQRAMVGLVDEFIDRFNGKTSHPDINDSSDEGYRKNLWALFDQVMINDTTSEKYKLASDFVDVTVRNKTKIQFKDTTWFALATCNCSLENKELELLMFLTVEHRGGDMYKWVISKIMCPKFDTKPTNLVGRTMIDPDANENNFMKLSRITSEEPQNITAFMNRNFKYDENSVFAYLVFNNKLKINHVNNLEFVFTQIPGFIFHIHDFARESGNSGWLISNIYRSSDDNAIILLNDIWGNKSEPEEKSTSVLEEGQLVDTNFIKKLFIIRTQQKLQLMRDYIDFIQDGAPKNVRNLYAEKLRNMFVDDAYVRIKSKDTLNTYGKITIDEFCNTIGSKTMQCERLDFITVPILNCADILSNPDESVKKCPGVVIPFVYPSNTNLVSTQTLDIYKVEAEYGIEWLPKFGNLTITIKR